MHCGCLFVGSRFFCSFTWVWILIVTHPSMSYLNFRPWLTACCSLRVMKKMIMRKNKLYLLNNHCSRVLCYFLVLARLLLMFDGQRDQRNHNSPFLPAQPVLWGLWFLLLRHGKQQHESVNRCFSNQSVRHSINLCVCACVRLSSFVCLWTNVWTQGTIIQLSVSQSAGSVSQSILGISYLHLPLTIYICVVCLFVAWSIAYLLIILLFFLYLLVLDSLPINQSILLFF